MATESATILMADTANAFQDLFGEALRVGRERDVMIPAISQWPVIVSLPLPRLPMPAPDSKLAFAWHRARLFLRIYRASFERFRGLRDQSR